MGCFAGLKRLFSSGQQRPSQSVAAPTQPTQGPRRSLSLRVNETVAQTKSLARSASNIDLAARGRNVARRSSVSKQSSQQPAASPSPARSRSQSPQRPKSSSKPKSAPKQPKSSDTNGRGESRPTGLFAGVRPPLSDATTSRTNTTGAEQRSPRMMSAKDLRGLGMERARHHPIKVDGPAGSTSPRQAHDNLPSPPEQAHLKSRVASKESLTSLAAKTSAGKSAGVRQSSSIAERRASRNNTANTAATSGPVELPGEFVDIMEKEAVSNGSDVGSDHTASDTSKVSTIPTSAGNVKVHLRPDGLGAIVELPGSAVPPSPKDSFAISELPGSNPFVIDKASGSSTPSELPGSIPYSMHKKMIDTSLFVGR